MLYLPRSASPIHVQEQYGQLQMWVETELGAPEVDRHFRVFVTGQPIDSIEGLGITHVGTALMEGGAFVAHVYEATPVCSDKCKLAFQARIEDAQVEVPTVKLPGD